LEEGEEGEEEEVEEGENGSLRADEYARAKKKTFFVLHKRK
jgi:hypothetical protein